MPRYNRRKPIRRARYNRRNNTVAKMAYKAYKKVKNISYPELKRFDVPTFTVAPSFATPTISLVSNVAQGNDSNQRSGNHIFCKSYYLRWRLASTSPVGTSHRCLIVMDTQNNGTVPSITDILQTNNYLSPMNYDTSNRFKVLRDKLFLTSQGTTQDKMGKYYFKINKGIKYTGPSQNDIYKNQIFVVWLTDSAVGALSVQMFSRMGYNDS